LTTTTEKELITIVNKKQTKEQAATPTTGCLVIGEVQSIFVIVGVMEDNKEEEKKPPIATNNA